MSKAAYGRVPFKEQIEFFKRKAPLASDTWTQLYTTGHDHGFVVAGANREALIKDFFQAVDSSISNGDTLENFRKDFDTIVASHGWDYNGSRSWRSRVIYETNLRTSYAAGRHEQMQSMSETHPYWMYVHSDAVQTPRPEHIALDGLVLRHDDPFWNTHYPPNGWGCQCQVRALTKRQAIKMGKVADDGSTRHKAPNVRMQTVTIGQNGPSPRTVQVPRGIDPGFEYAPGATSKGGNWISKRASDAMRSAPDLDNRWQPVTSTGPIDYDRPKDLILHKMPAPLAPKLSDNESMVDRVRSALGGQQRVFNVKGLPIAIDANVLGEHLSKSPGRSEYLPWLTDLLTDPWEVWLNLYRDKQTGKYELRTRIIKAYQQDSNGRGVLLVAQQGGGFLEGWTFIPARRMHYMQRQRVGKLWYGK